MTPKRKRKMINGAIVGLISGLIVSVVCYFAASPNPSYFIFAVFGLAIGMAQAYLSPE